MFKFKYFVFFVIFSLTLQEVALAQIIPNLPAACLPERAVKGAPTDNNHCHCPPKSSCDEIVNHNGQNDKLPQYFKSR